MLQYNAHKLCEDAVLNLVQYLVPLDNNLDYSLRVLSFQYHTLEPNPHTKNILCRFYFPLLFTFFFYVVHLSIFLAKSAHCVLYSPSPRFKFDERNEEES